MKIGLVGLITSLVTLSQAFAHCQVPCGIYGDDARFEEMLEHVATIEKASNQIGELAGKTDAQSVQQVMRWVMTKETHAQAVQEICLDYFLAQRIKSDGENYPEKLATIHSVIVGAMKCKQNADGSHAIALRAYIEEFRGVYKK